MRGPRVSEETRVRCDSSHPHVGRAFPLSNPSTIERTAEHAALPWHCSRLDPRDHEAMKCDDNHDRALESSHIETMLISIPHAALRTASEIDLQASPRGNRFRISNAS